MFVVLLRHQPLPVPLHLLSNIRKDARKWPRLGPCIITQCCRRAFQGKKIIFFGSTAFNFTYFAPQTETADSTITEKGRAIEPFPPLTKPSPISLHICTYQFRGETPDLRSSTGNKLKSLELRNLTAVDIVRGWEGAPPGLQCASAPTICKVGNVGQPQRNKGISGRQIYRNKGKSGRQIPRNLPRHKQKYIYW